jgi:replicative DNA helicase
MTGRDDLSAAHAEASVLGAVLIGGDIDVARTTLPQPADTHGWTVEGHWTVWAAILAVADRGDVPDTVAVAQQLMDGGTIDRVGGPAGVAALASSAPAPSSAPCWGRSASTASSRWSTSGSRAGS